MTGDSAATVVTFRLGLQRFNVWVFDNGSDAPTVAVNVRDGNRWLPLEMMGDGEIEPVEVQR